MSGEMNLLRDFERKAIENRVFFTPLIEITDACNARCIFCYRRENEAVKGSMLSLDVIKRLAGELREIGAFHVKLTGGEPLCHPDFVEIVKVIRDNNLSVKVVTNGILFNQTMINMLKETYLNTVVSLNAITKTVYSQVMGIDGSNLAVAMDNVKRIKDAGLGIAVTLVANRFNIDQAQDFEGYWKEYEVPVLWQRISPAVDGLNAKLIPSEEQLRRFFKYLGKDRIPKHNYNDPTKCLRCNAGFNMGILSANGDVLACTLLRLKIGNFFENSLHEIWTKGEGIQEYRRRVTDPEAESACFTCDSNEYCEYCMGDHYNSHVDIFTPNRDYCIVARTAKHVYEELCNTE